MEPIRQLPKSALPGAKLTFGYFPAFAAFIKNNYLIPYIQEQLLLSKAIDLPLLKYFAGIPHDELISMSISSNTEFLLYAEQNKLDDQINLGIDRWLSDQSTVIKRDEVVAEDLTLAAYVRKMALMKFLPSYTSDMTEMLAIVAEIETFTTAYLTRTSNTFIALLRKRISDETHFSESISDVTPGLNYVFSLKDKLIKYANKNYLDHFGYSLRELQEIGRGIIPEFMHPEDLENHRAQLKRCKALEDKEVNVWEYRLNDRRGGFKWMRNYASVFKRNAGGTVDEIIGIILDIDHEKRNAEKLLYSEQQLMQAQAITHTGSWSWDLQTDEVLWSDELYRIYELDPHNENVDPAISRLYRHPDDMAMVDAEMEKLRETYQPVDYNYRIQFLSGRIKHLNAKGEVLFDKKGKPVSIFGTVQDITEKQTLLEQLQHSDALYKQAQAISRTGNWSWELATRKMEWSDELYHIYELTPGTVTESILTASFNHPDDRAMIAEVIKRAIERLEPFDFHYRIVLKSGKTKILHAMGTTERQPGSNGYKMVGTLQDVTEQKTAEKQLKEYKEFIEKITDVTPCIITTYNIHTGKYSFVNDEIEKKLGYTASQLLTEGVAFAATLIHPDDVAQVTAQNQAALAMADEKGDAANEPVMEFKYRLRNKAGEYRWFHTYGTVFERNEKGKVESVLNISVDISMQEAAQQALQLNNIQLQQSNTSLEEYAYVASHDLKEPLRKIATFADRILATQYDLLSADGKVYLEKIIDASRRMQKLISDLLSVSTILGNKAFEPYDLNDALYDTLQQLDQKIEEKKAVITCAPLPMATVVPQQFRQLFLNLVNNALKFSRPDEPLQLQIKWQYLDAKDAEQYGIVHARRYLKLEFADNGIGFDNQYAGKIFAIFQRLHGKVEYEGTGIGLAVCKKIAENHGGIIYARGVPGKSAIFTLIIPA